MLKTRLKKIILVLAILIAPLLSATTSQAQDTDGGILDAGGNAACIALVENPSSIEGLRACCKINEDTTNSGVAAKCREVCRDSDFKFYTSTTCTDILLGVTEVNSELLFIRQNPTIFVIIVVQFFLTIILLFAVLKVLTAGYTVTSAGADGEKRTEGFKKAFNSILGMILSFSSLGITTAVKNFINPEAPVELLRDCDELEEQGADPEVIEDCRKLEVSDPT